MLPPEWHYIELGDLDELALATDIVDEDDGLRQPTDDGNWDQTAQ